MRDGSLLFPDGTPIDEWFFRTDVPALEDLEKSYDITDYGILPDGTIQTKKLQALIDLIHNNGGGVVVIPAGTFLTGAVYFKQGVSLYICKGGVLKGSDDLADYPICMTRIEGECCRYFPALINAEGLSDFIMAGEGIIDGNGSGFWRDFWYRRDWNPGCTNKDSQRPRLIYLSHCTDVIVAGLRFQNAAFWTNHLYKCSRVKYLGCSVYSPFSEEEKAPSTDAIDIDACTDILIKNCRMEVNDDAVALKGGKGPWADRDPDNGSNERILIEDCEYGFCHGCLTFGSENIHSRNIIIRNIKVQTGYNVLWFKMRPDTPQIYEYVLMENITGKAANFLNINPWTQFFDLKGRKDLPVSLCRNITIRNCTLECDTFFNVKQEESQYHLAQFNMENLKIATVNVDFYPEYIEEIQCNNIAFEKTDKICFPDSVTTVLENNVDWRGKALQ